MWLVYSECLKLKTKPDLKFYLETLLSVKEAQTANGWLERRLCNLSIHIVTLLANTQWNLWMWVSSTAFSWLKWVRLKVSHSCKPFVYTTSSSSQGCLGITLTSGLIWGSAPPQQGQAEMHQLPWLVSLVAFTACASCCAFCVTLSARLGSVTGIWAPGVVVGEERLQQCCAQAGQCPTLAGAWLAGLGPTLILSFVTSLDMQDLVSGGKELKGVESSCEQREPRYCGSSQGGAEWSTSLVFGSTAFYLWWFHSCNCQKVLFSLSTRFLPK